MILNPRSSARRSGLVAGGVALAWGGFVLTGAASPPQNAQEPQSHVEETEVTVLSADGGEFTLEPLGNIMFMGDDIMSLDATGPGMMKIFTNCDGDDARFSGVWVGALNADQLAAFGAAHPSADADGDGTVNAAEHDAYFVALALENAPALLGKYPKVDRNADGALQPDEAARFVVGGLMIDNMPKPPVVKGRWTTRLGDGQAVEDGHEGRIEEVRIELKAEANADGTLLVTPIVAGAKPADGADCVRVVEVGKADGAACMVTAAGAELPVPPTRWLAENTSGAPTTAEVASVLPITVQAPLNLFLELNPEADANGDGKLTAEERDDFVQRHQTRMRSRLLERHPEADTNSDGLLTDGEVRTFRLRFPLTGGGVHRITLRATSDGENVAIEQNGDAKTVVVQPEKP